MKKPKMKPIRYFYYRGDLHKKMHINRGADVISAWNYPKGKLEKYSYTDVKKNGEKAFSTQEVATMMSRNYRTISNLLMSGEIRRPQKQYKIDEHRNGHAFYWCEKDIMELHKYFTGIHRGRPRNDGIITPQKLPTAAELRAMIRQGTVLYIKDDDGNFVPTWDAEKF